jgi:KDO2-lipid IV(A) lauroyltransferase
MYRICYYFLYALSLIPWRIMYALSDAIYFLVYYIIGYRKEVVIQNLNIAFPEKSTQEKTRIAKDCFHQLIDTFIETIKIMSISKAELNKRFKCNYEVVNDLYETGQNVQIHGGHFFNWEYVNVAFSANIQYPFMGIYLPLTNKIFDKIMYDLRTRFGSIAIPAFTFNRAFIKYARGRYALTLGADQNAGDLSNSYWLPYFGIMAPFVTGPERMAVAKDTAIVFTHCYRVKRGYYQAEFELFTKTPKDLPKGAITIALRDYLEQKIRKRPSNYLWTHRRWKHPFDPQKFGDMVIENPPNLQ